MPPSDSSGCRAGRAVSRLRGAHHCPGKGRWLVGAENSPTLPLGGDGKKHLQIRNKLSIVEKVDRGKGPKLQATNSSYNLQRAKKSNHWQAARYQSNNAALLRTEQRLHQPASVVSSTVNGILGSMSDTFRAGRQEVS